MTAFTYTRCPGCATVFRVTEEQLALRDGQVRCGKCRAVFDANNHVITREASGAAVAPADVTPTIDFGDAAEVVAEALHGAHEPVSASEDVGLDGLEQAPAVPGSEYSQPLETAEVAGAPQATALASDLEPLPASTAKDGEDAADGASNQAVVPMPMAEDGEQTAPVATHLAGVPAATAEAGTQTAPLPADSAAASAPIAEVGAHAGGVSSDADASIGEAGSKAATEPPDEVLAPTPAVEPGAAASADRPIRYEWKPRTRLREQPKALYGVAAVILLLTLAAQAVYGYRDLLAAHLPSTRPLLQAACGTLGCVIEPLRDTAALSIEASDLQADPAHRGLLVLSATVRNRAPYAIAYPYLELTLTDASDGVVARRSFAPAEYAGGTANVGAGIPANGEKIVKLFLDASATSQAGYRLYLFYP